MKKTAVLCAFTALAGCSAQPVEYQEYPQEEAVYIEEALPEGWGEVYVSEFEDAAGGQGIDENVLKPRVVDVLSTNMGRPEDGFDLGGGMTVVPDVPEVYSILANRAANTFLKETSAVFEQPEFVKLYVDTLQTDAEDLPGGAVNGEKLFKKRLADAGNILVVDDKDMADYVVVSSVNWLDTASKKVPAVRYDVVLNDKGGTKIGEWSEVVHRVENDKSWW